MNYANRPVVIRTNHVAAPVVEKTNLFETSNRRLEQFLFVHDIFHTGWYKNSDGLTTWTYPDTPEVKRVVAEYREIDARRNARKTNVVPMGKYLN